VDDPIPISGLYQNAYCPRRCDAVEFIRTERCIPSSTSTVSGG